MRVALDSVWFNSNTFLRLYPRTRLFVVIRSGHTLSGLARGYKKHVIARGRISDDGKLLRMTRGEITLKQLRDWLRTAGYGTKVVGAKRR